MYNTLIHYKFFFSFFSHLFLIFIEQVKGLQVAPAELEDTLRDLEGRDADHGYDQINVDSQTVDIKPTEAVYMSLLK